jgi:hypothetical protein
MYSSRDPCTDSRSCCRLEPSTDREGIDAVTKSKKRQKVDKSKAYTWVAYMFTHEPAEIQRVLKYGTPSDRLIKLAENPIAVTTTGKLRLLHFPESLNKSSGQKLLFNAAQRISTYIKTTPIQAYDVLQDVLQNVTHRRSDTQRNIHMVAEAVCHRSASEFKHEILFAFDSIITWIKAVHGKELGYLTVRRCLEALEASGHIKVKEWGVRGNRSKATKIEILPLPQEYILTYTSKVDDWLLFLDHAMTKVYQRESITRQNVLEERIHHFADELAAESPAWQPLAGLFGDSDDKIDVEALVPSSEIEEKEIWNDIYIDRLLGRLVPTLQENGSPDRQGRARVSRC